MVLTILEAKVEAARAGDLEREFAAADLALTPGIVESMLVRDARDPSLFQIQTVWASRQALEAMRALGTKPKGVQMFEAAGATPTLTIREIVTRHLK